MTLCTKMLYLSVFLTRLLRDQMRVGERAFTLTAKSFPKQGLCHGLGSTGCAAWRLSRADRLTLALFTLALVDIWTISAGRLCPASLSDSEDGLVPTCCGIRPSSGLPNPSEEHF